MCIRDSLLTFEQALSLFRELSENFSLLFEKQSEYLGRKIADLIQERDELSENYAETDKTLH